MASNEIDIIDGEAIEINKFGYTEEEHARIVVNVNTSFLHDYDGSRRRYADSVSTSEVLRKRRNQVLNGH